ncbi:MAG: lytic transglycosylase domain-containing protein [Deltaproteobacteria bacterium]|nr:lytic transglycosylase domain-containing protein [Deltaproteobacteria bacterium]
MPPSKAKVAAQGALRRPRGSGARTLLASAAVLIFPLVLLPQSAQADIYSHIDKEGVVHFTNIPRSGPKWKRVMKTGPGKARIVHAQRRRRHLSADRYTRYDVHIRQASVLYHMPEALVRAIIHVESDYDPGAVSRVGARGLMQLMPRTGRGMGVTAPFNARQNIFGGTRFLRVLANRFSGDLVLTIASYHAGAGAVSKYHGIPPYRTTQRYVRMVLAKYYKYRRLLASR